MVVTEVDTDVVPDVAVREIVAETVAVREAVGTNVLLPVARGVMVRDMVLDRVSNCVRVNVRLADVLRLCEVDNESDRDSVELSLTDRRWVSVCDIERPDKLFDQDMVASSDGEKVGVPMVTLSESVVD